MRNHNSRQCLRWTNLEIGQVRWQDGRGKLIPVESWNFFVEYLLNTLSIIYTLQTRSVSVTRREAHDLGHLEW